MKSSIVNTLKLSEEVKDLWRKNKHYLLSHHEEGQSYRCYTLNIESKTFNLCARCSGIYPGIFLGLASQGLSVNPPFWLIAFSGVPTLVEKYFTGLKGFKGYNSLRSLTGVLLGYGYIGGVFDLLRDPFNTSLLILGLFYGLMAGLLIFYEHRK